MVFEKLVVDQLNVLLGTFIEGMDHRQLVIDTSKGQVKLEDVAMKTFEFNELLLPIALKSGHLGKLWVDWSYIKNLWKTDPPPIKVELENVQLCFCPHRSEDWDRQKCREARFKLLRLIDMLDKGGNLQLQKSGFIKETDPLKFLTQDNFGTRFLFRTANNVRVHLSNISIIYENLDLETEDPPFCFTLSLGTLAGSQSAFVKLLSNLLRLERA